MLYKVRLKQITENINSIKASTLFGAFITAYSSYIDIDEELINDITLSDLFTVGQLPIGIKDNTTIYNKRSFGKKQVYINRTFIARDSNSNNIVNVKQGEFCKEQEFYINTDILSKDEITNIVKSMTILGIGTWRNVGKGQFELISVEEYIPDINKTKFVVLSAFIPSNDDINNVVELGYEIRQATAMNGIKQQSVTLLKTGTVLKTGNKIIGKHLYDKNSNTYIHGKAIAIGV